MGWVDAVITAVVGIVGVVVGAAVSLRQTQKTLSSNKILQNLLVDANRDLSREEREHQQRRDAYVPMMEYVTWATRVNQVRTEVIDRRRIAVQKYVTANVKNITAADVAAMHAAYDNSGPTEWEQKMIDAGPTVQDRFRILGSAYAFASKDVLEKFLRVDDSTERIEREQVRIEKAMMDFPNPLGPQPSISEVAAAAKRQIASVGEMTIASLEMLDATKQYSEVTESFRDTVRKELDRIRSKVDEPVRLPAIATPPKNPPGAVQPAGGTPV